LLIDIAQLTAFFVAFAAVLASGRWVIAKLHVLKFGQNINTDAPDRHLQKQGTPTMGGVLFVIGVIPGVLAAMAVGRGRGLPLEPLGAVLIVFLVHAAIGFVDDFLSIKGGKSLGLKARHKLLLQVIVAAGFLFWLAGQHLPQTTCIVIGRTIDLGPAYYLFALILMVGLSNATNLTDGLDGLAGGLAIPVAIGLILTVSPVLVGYATPTWFAGALAGACLSFLWFNAHPAKVFMGDTGSLAIGGSFAALAIVDKQEILLLVLALVYLVEMVSVMIQVSYFKLTHGKRVFKMTPIHHHFELSGWAETHVVARFWIVGALALMVALGLHAAGGW